MTILLAHNNLAMSRCTIILIFEFTSTFALAGLLYELDRQTFLNPDSSQFFWASKCLIEINIQILLHSLCLWWLKVGSTDRVWKTYSEILIFVLLKFRFLAWKVYIFWEHRHLLRSSILIKSTDLISCSIMWFLIVIQRVPYKIT